MSKKRSSTAPLPPDEVLALAKRKMTDIEKRAKKIFTKLSFNTQIDAEKGTFGFTNRPDEDTVKAVIMDVRHFLAQDSPIAMSKVVYAARTKFPERVKDIDHFYLIWRRQTGQKKDKRVMAMSLNLEGKEVTQDVLLDLWINGDFFHLDPKKQSTLEEVRSNPFRGLLEMNFLATVQNLAALLVHFKQRYLDTN